MRRYAKTAALQDGAGLKILHFIQSLITGGAQRQLTYLSREQVRRGHSVHIAVLDGGDCASDLAGTGAVVHSLRAGAMNFARGRGIHNYDFRLLFRVRRLIDRLQPDLAQTWITQMDVLGGLGCYLAGTPWILREPASALAYDVSLSVRLKAWARLRVGRTAAGVVCNSTVGTEYWLKMQPRLARYVIPNGVPLEEIDGAAASSGIISLPPAEALVLYVGRMDDRQKNVSTLIPAAAKVLKIRPATRFLLCGEGPSLPKIRQMIGALGLEGKVLTPGNVTGVWGIMKQANVFASVSRFEGIPNAVMEAMACRCPLVVSDIPEHRAFLSSESALFTPSEDADSIASAILNSLSDPAAGRSRANKARRVIEEFSLDRMARRYDDVYRDVLSRTDRNKR
jgi:glycosyltransferase involved in cell wall biosynthesis